MEEEHIVQDLKYTPKKRGRPFGAKDKSQRSRRSKHELEKIIEAGATSDVPSDDKVVGGIAVQTA